MNILYLNHNVVWRSTFHRCFLFARELVRLGHDVTILTNSPTARWRFKEYMHDGVRIIESPDLFWGSLRTGWDPWNVVRRCLYLRGKKYDLIHAFDTRPTVILPALFYKFAVRSMPLVIDWADWWGRGGVTTLRKHKFLNWLFTPVETFFEEKLRPLAAHTTVISTSLQNRAIGLGISSRSITLVPSGADVRTFFPMDKSATRQELDIPLSARVCIFPSFVLYDLQYVLEAFRLVYDADPNALLFLVGEFPRMLGKRFDDLVSRRVIRRLGPMSKEQMRPFLAASDVGLLPLSRTIANESRFPMKFGDYLAAQIPIATMNVGDVGKMVRRHQLGYIANDGVKGFAETIQWIIRHPEQAAQRAKRARVYAAERFSFRVFALRLLTIYTHLVTL